MVNNNNTNGKKNIICDFNSIGNNKINNNNTDNAEVSFKGLVVPLFLILNLVLQRQLELWAAVSLPSRSILVQNSIEKYTCGASNTC